MAVTASMIMRERGWALLTQEAKFTIRGPGCEYNVVDDEYMTQQLRFEKVVFEVFGVPVDMRSYTSLASRVSFERVRKNLEEAGFDGLEGYLARTVPLVVHQELGFLEALEKDIGDSFRVADVTEKQQKSLTLMFPTGGYIEGLGFYNPALMDYKGISEKIRNSGTVAIVIDLRSQQRVAAVATTSNAHTVFTGGLLALLDKYWHHAVEAMDETERDVLFWTGFARKPSRKEQGKIATLAETLPEMPVEDYCVLFARTLTAHGMECDSRGAAGQALRLKGQFSFILGKLKYVGNKRQG